MRVLAAPMAWVRASEMLKELFPGDLYLAQDAVEQPRANYFAGVNRNHGFSAIAVPQEMVAPPHTAHASTQTL